MSRQAAYDDITLAFVSPLFSGVDPVRLWWLLAAVRSLAAILHMLDAARTSWPLVP